MLFVEKISIQIWPQPRKAMAIWQERSFEGRLLTRWTQKEDTIKRISICQFHEVFTEGVYALPCQY
jgi:hypothetical protein